MVEVAFKIDKSSDFYKEYFDAKAEKQKFHDYAREFFARHDLVDDAKYYQCDFLGMGLNSEQKKRFADQIKKYDDHNGMTLFKKKSAMQKEWTETVVNKVDMKTCDACSWWYFPFIGHGSHSLWDEDGEIYGYLMDSYKSEINLYDYMIPLKMSEYYAIKERYGD